MAKKTNIASSGYTAIQAGHIGPPDDETPAGAAPEPPKPTSKGQTVNVRRGNARVGVQADTIVGDITIQM